MLCAYTPPPAQSCPWIGLIIYKTPLCCGNAQSNPLTVKYWYATDLFAAVNLQDITGQMVTQLESQMVVRTWESFNSVTCILILHKAAKLRLLPVVMAANSLPFVVETTRIDSSHRGSEISRAGKSLVDHNWHVCCLFSLYLFVSDYPFV